MISEFETESNIKRKWEMDKARQKINKCDHKLNQINEHDLHLRQKGTKKENGRQMKMDRKQMKVMVN